MYRIRQLHGKRRKHTRCIHSRKCGKLLEILQEQEMPELLGPQYVEDLDRHFTKEEAEGVILRTKNNKPQVLKGCQLSLESEVRVL